MSRMHYECPCMEMCPLNKAMEMIGGKWKMQILCSIGNSKCIRYGELRRKLDGISNTVLSKALKELEKDDLIKRREYLQIPVKVEYSMTTRGETIMPILDNLSKWGEGFIK